jgi:glycosyltransferase involved in cell wall biosynthesis
VKILQISPTYSGIGGIAQHVRGLEKYLINTGNNVDILSSDNSFTLPIKGLKNPSFMLSSSLKSRFMKKYDIIHAHNIPSAKAMKNAKGKKILTLHGIFSEQIDILHGKTTGNISKKYENTALKSADAITVVSKDAQEYYSKLGFNAYHIPNAIDIESLPKNENKMFENQIIYAGRLSKEKGILELLSISKKLPEEIHLIIVGTGPEENIVKLASEQKNIHYFGYLPPEKTIPLIRGSKILVQPSLVEGISSTILESMACQTSIITSNVGGNVELITNNKNGLIIDSQNSDSFVRQIISLIDDEELRKSFENESLKIVKKYDWNQVGKLYLNIYKSLLDSSD